MGAPRPCPSGSPSLPLYRSLNPACCYSDEESLNTPLSLERVALLRVSTPLFALLFWCSAALAPSLGAADTHGTLAGSPYQVAATLSIPRGTVLTVDPGVVVRVAPGASIDVAGQMLAEGTAAQKITFERQGASG